MRQYILVLLRQGNRTGTDDAPGVHDAWFKSSPPPHFYTLRGAEIKQLYCQLLNWDDASICCAEPFIIVARQPVGSDLLSVIGRFNQRCSSAHSWRRSTGINLNIEPFSILIVQHVEGAKRRTVTSAPCMKSTAFHWNFSVWLFCQKDSVLNGLPRGKASDSRSHQVRHRYERQKAKKMHCALELAKRARLGALKNQHRSASILEIS